MASEIIIKEIDKLITKIATKYPPNNKQSSVISNSPDPTVPSSNNVNNTHSDRQSFNISDNDTLKSVIISYSDLRSEILSWHFSENINKTITINDNCQIIMNRNGDRS